jgi:crossover junction endodeoxyribonuclease RuvC
MTIIGIDPGKNGGVAWNLNGRYAVEKMPSDMMDLWDLLKGIANEGPCCALLENVHSMPGQGVVSSFTFGKGFGSLQMALCGLGISYELIEPRKWQKALGCLTKGDKNVSKAKAQALFPDIKVTHAKADALLICRYAVEVGVC